MKTLLIFASLVGLSNAHASYPDEYRCMRNYVACPGGQCLPAEKKCNYLVDCSDGSDEYECSAQIKCLTGYKVCKLDNEQMTIVLMSMECPEENLGCGPRPMIENGEIQVINYDSSIGAEAYVVCDEGYTTCKTSVHCLPSGNWEISTCDAIPPPVLNCYQCSNKETNEMCNTGTETCSPEENCCQTIVEWENGTLNIKDKRCVNPFTVTTPPGCTTSSGVTTCHYYCHDQNLCNDEIPTPEVDEDSGKTSCFGEHGVCNRKSYQTVRTIAHSNSNCRKYCECTHMADGRYRWVKKDCPDGMLFDNSKNQCNLRRFVECQSIEVDRCTALHGECNETMLDQKRAIPNTDCKDFCKCNVYEVQTNGDPVYNWVERTCPDRKLFKTDNMINACRRMDYVNCQSPSMQ